MRVAVYRNLNTKEQVLWSIKCMDRSKLYKPWYGLVIAHADHVLLQTANFKVGQKGRDRVLKTKQKNVHAYVVGDLKEVNLIRERHTLISQIKDIKRSKEGFSLRDLNISKRTYYDPYKHESFVTVEDSKLQPIRAADNVWLRTSGEVYSLLKPLASSKSNSLPTWC